MGTHPIFESDFDCLTVLDSKKNLSHSFGASKLKMGIRRDWYQSDERIILALLTKGAQNVKVDFQVKQISVSGTGKDGDFEESVDLENEIVPGESFFKVLSTKIELRLKKSERGLRWTDLEPTSEPAKPVQHNQSKNWDRLEKEVVEEEQKEIESAGGDAALQQMFKKIYGNANEDTKRAMLKSFQESNGTVLSTNWNEVGKEKVEMKPPDSMEFKKWEG